jgi:4-hydroxy-tetrahydrodipicolinate reductase
LATLQSEEVKPRAVFTRRGSALKGNDVGELVGIGKCDIIITDDPNAAINDSDVLIYFARSEAILEYLHIF